MAGVGMRRVARLVALVFVMVLPAIGPATALAAGGTSSSATPVPPSATNPLAPGVPVSPATVPSTTTATSIPQTTTSSTSGSGLSGTSAVEIAIVAVLVLGGIAFFIWRDARHRAPVRSAADATAGMAGGANRGSKAAPKSRKLSPAERRRRKRGRAKR